MVTIYSAKRINETAGEVHILCEFPTLSVHIQVGEKFKSVQCGSRIVVANNQYVYMQGMAVYSGKARYGRAVALQYAPGSSSAIIGNQMMIAIIMMLVGLFLK